jgi:hypothetical protein
MESSCRQVDSAGVLSGATGGTESLIPGSTNNIFGEGGNPVADLPKSSSGLVERSPGVGVSMFQPVCHAILTLIAVWYWRCAIRGGHVPWLPWCSRSVWLYVRPCGFQWRSPEPRTRAWSRSELNSYDPCSHVQSTSSNGWSIGWHRRPFLEHRRWYQQSDDRWYQQRAQQCRKLCF